MKVCSWHLCIKVLTGRRRKFCSDICKSKYYVTKNRERTKECAVEYKGGKCKKCGYNKCISALCFHHKYDKKFGISYKGICVSWERLKLELDKCDLLCLNCHAEVHAWL